MSAHAPKDREIYPSAPLQLVAFELRMPQVPEFAVRERLTQVYEKLPDIVPIIPPPAHQQSIQFQGGEVGFAVETSPRFLNRSRTLSVLVSPTRLVVETTQYERFEAFQEVVERVLDAAGENAPIAGIERVGLRYIDEVRVADVRTPAEWMPYVLPSLLSGVGLCADLPATGLHGLVEYQLSPTQQVNMRFGALEGRVVESSGPLRTRETGDGPFFLIDLDSFWTAPEDDMPEYSRERALEIFLSLRPPLRGLFEAAITDQLRDEVLRKEPA